MQAVSRITYFDWLILIVLLCLTSIVAIRTLNFSAYPIEDAAILMRYSQNLSQGEGIVWNIGEKPVDGATDFLFMVLLAMFVRVGGELELSTRLLGFTAHFITVAIIYLGIRKLHHSTRALACFAAFYLAIGPGLRYVEAYFGTTIFAMFVSLTWFFALKLMKGDESYLTSFLFSVSALMMGLTRPEGVFLALFMLLSVILMRGLRGLWTTTFALVFIIVGGLYFLWRWHYFGYPLPNPYYKKGGGQFHFSNLKTSINYTIFLSGPFVLLFLLGFRSLKKSHQTIILAIPIVGFMSLWVLLSNEMNYLMRFQYATLPLILLAFPWPLKEIRQDWHLPSLNESQQNQRGMVAFVAVVAIIILQDQYTTYQRVSHFDDGRYDVAIMLNNYSQQGYTIATTEAGLLPLYSNWKAIDTWGLNDQWIAHHGQITEEYLARYKPELIMFNAPFSPIVPAEGSGAWYSMVMTMKNYAETHNYSLVAAFGDTAYNTHYYYIRNDFADALALTKKIRAINYSWYLTGRKSINYALFETIDK